MRSRLVVLTTLTACRIGFDPVSGPPITDAPVDVAPADGPKVCPPDTVAITAGSTVCIELVQRGRDPWTFARDICASLSRRLCADAEWLTACESARAGLLDMVGPDYEWVAEESAGIAQKRGASSCQDPSAHAVVDPYDWRCCADR